jgi:hypothetical protein
MGTEQTALYREIGHVSGKDSIFCGVGIVESMGLETFSLTERPFVKSEIDALGGSSYRLGTGHRQYFSFERYPDVTIMLDNAHNCLVGLCLLHNGVFVFHDPPMKIYQARLCPPRGKMQRKIVGGGLSHWESTRERYEQECGPGFRYISKPEKHRENVDFSFALILDMKQRAAAYGYYYNPKGLSGDGWNWE